MKTPALSVILPTYNDGRFLRQAVESILNQTFEDSELIIVDDASNDETPDILSSMDDPRVRVARNERNLGLPASLNRCIGMVRGRFVARMDGDDLSKPERFARQIAFLEAHPDIGVVGTFVEEIDEQGRVIRRAEYPAEPETIRELLINGYQRIVHASCMFRAEVFRTVGLYDTRFAMAEDTDLFLRVQERFDIAALPEYLYQYRRHSRSLVLQDPVRVRALIELAYYLFKARRAGKDPTRGPFALEVGKRFREIESARFSPAFRAETYMNHAKYSLCRGLNRRAVAWAWRAIRANGINRDNFWVLRQALKALLLRNSDWLER